MDRRKFIATSGSGIGLGIAGCLDVTVGDESDSSEGPGDGDSSNQEPSDGDDSPSTNESGDGGGDDADGDDADDDGAEGDETDDESEGDADDNDEQSDSGDLSVEFESCSRAVVSGSFEDGDVAYASTGFYDDAGFGNTLLEDGVTFGDDVDAPFTGTVVFEVGSGSSVDAGDDEIVVEIPDYGEGTVITGLTTDQEDYFVVALTHENPHAEDCLDEQAPDDEDPEHEDGPDGGDDGENDTDDGGEDDGNGDENGDESADDGDDGPPAFDVTITGTNAPVDAGDFVEISGELENTGGSGTETVRLVVGRSSETVESRSVTLEAGERTTITEGYQTPPVEADQEVPMRIETESDSAEETVLVRGA